MTEVSATPRRCALSKRLLGANIGARFTLSLDRGAANHLVRGARLIDAERLFRQEVAGGSVRPSAATHANVAELAAAALSFQVVVVAQLGEDVGVVPDFRETLLPQVTRERRQISAREDLALVRDKTDAGSRQAALCHGIHVAGVAGVSDRPPASRLQIDPCRTWHGHVRRSNLVGARRGRLNFIATSQAVGSLALPRHPKIM